jgi:hypothetical protein
MRAGGVGAGMRGTEHALAALAGLLAACSGPAAPTPAPPQPAPVVYEAPRPDPPAELTELCWSGVAEAVAGPRSTTIYSLEPIELVSVAYGPRIANMPRAGSRRTEVELRQALARAAGDLAACQSWAVDREPGLARRGLSVPFEFTVDAFGAPRSIEVGGQAPELAACVADVLAIMWMSGRTPRLTRVTARLDFEPLDPVSGAERPRPRLPDGYPGQCLRAPAELPIDRLELERVRIGQRPRRDGGRPQLRLGCASVRPTMDRRRVVDTIGYNLGAYRECVRDNPGRGRIDARLRVDQAGSVSAEVSGAGNRALHACLTEALEALWFQPSPAEWFEVEVPLELVAARVEPIDGDDPVGRGRRALERGDGAVAIAAFAELARSSAEPTVACQARLGVLRGAMLEAPWVRDELVARAAAELLAVLGDAGGNCLTEAVAAIEMLATWPFVGPVSRAGPGLAEAVDATRERLAVAPDLPWTAGFRRFAGDGLMALGQHEAAIDAYVDLLRTGPLPRADVIAAMDGFLAADRDRRAEPVLRPGMCTEPHH